MSYKGQESSSKTNYNHCRNTLPDTALAYPLLLHQQHTSYHSGHLSFPASSGHPNQRNDGTDLFPDGPPGKRPVGRTPRPSSETSLDDYPKTELFRNLSDGLGKM